MKKVQKALLATSMAGALVVGAGFGTYSWFTSSTKADGAIDNGTLSVNNGEVITTKLMTAEKFAPSQYVSGNFVTLDNTGNLEQSLKLNFTSTVDKAPADPYKVYYVAIKYKQKPSGDVIKNWRSDWERGFFKGNHNPHEADVNMLAAAASSQLPDDVEVVTGEATLEDAQAVATLAKTSKIVNDGNSKTLKLGNDKFFTLKEDQYIDIAFDVKLDQSAGNEYQGAKYSAALTVKAKQTDEGAKYAKDEDK